MADGSSRDLARATLAVLFIGGLMISSFFVVQPFLAATVWVIATWPLMLRAETAFGGRRWPAVTLAFSITWRLSQYP